MRAGAGRGNRGRTTVMVALAVVAAGSGLGYAGQSGALTHDGVMAQLRARLSPQAAAATAAAPVEQAVPRATCGPGSAPETGLQGEVPQKDIDSGRADQPYTCNLKQLNEPVIGETGDADPAGLQAAYYKHCAYYGQLAPPGTRVVDVSDRRNPKITDVLRTPAMVDPWESLKVHAGRGLLAAVEGSLDGPLWFDIYDIKADCTKPKRLASVPMNTIGHEGEFSQDGMVYYASAAAPGILTAIDVSDPTLPRIITSTVVSQASHGMSTNKDGTRLYLVDPSTDTGPGMFILDVSEIKAGVPGAQPKTISHIKWADGGFTQHTIPVSYKGHPYVIHIDESNYGAIRVIDIANERKPFVVSNIRTEIQLTQNRARADATGGSSGFAYNAHYCNVDRLIEPTTLACSERKSGVRVFDIRNVFKPREIAYWNHFGEMSAQVMLDPVRGELWTTDYTWGLVVTKFTNGVWPFKASNRR